MSKIMIFGAGGQLGRELVRLYPNAMKFYHKPDQQKEFVDVTNSESVRSTITESSPDVVINAAALANVDLCEKDHSLAYEVNGESVQSMVSASRTIGATFIHISTDYVFDGKDGNYNEKSLPNPINYYGLSKLVGDVYALSYENSLVVRTSGVFGYQKNFPLYVFDTIRNNKTVNAFEGFYSPIHARNLAKAVSISIERGINGLINFSGERISRAELARNIAHEFSLDASLVNEVKSLTNLDAKRPFDSSLDNSLAKSLVDFDFYSVKSNLKVMRDVFEEKY